MRRKVIILGIILAISTLGSPVRVMAQTPTPWDAVVKPYDVNGDGLVCQAEVVGDGSGQEIWDMMSGCDLSGDGCISESEANGCAALVPFVGTCSDFGGDSDKDGVCDDYDACPNLPGPGWSDGTTFYPGCPDGVKPSDATQNTQEGEGVPVGSGLFLLLGCVAAYALTLKRKNKTELKIK